MLLVEAPDAAPGDVLREVDDDRVRSSNDKHCKPAGPAKEPVARPIAPYRSAVAPAGDEASREDEGDEDEAWQPGRLARDQLDLQKIQGQGKRQRHEQGESERPRGMPVE